VRALAHARDAHASPSAVVSGATDAVGAEAELVFHEELMRAGSPHGVGAV